MRWGTTSLLVLFLFVDFAFARSPQTETSFEFHDHRFTSDCHNLLNPQPQQEAALGFADEVRVQFICMYGEVASEMLKIEFKGYAKEMGISFNLEVNNAPLILGNTSSEYKEPESYSANFSPLSRL